jgi:hypothetical protein
MMRQLDDALGRSDLASAVLHDTRRGKNTVHRLDGLFRQSVFGRLAGYEAVNDAERLALDPVMCQVVGGRAVDAQAASVSQMGRFETETLALLANRETLADLSGHWIDRFLEDFEYQAASWDKERRVIAKIEWHPGELFPRVGFIVTNLPMEPDWVMGFYIQRGTAEQHIKEGKYAFRWTRLSCRKFRDNEVRLQLHALAGRVAKAVEILWRRAPGI